MASLSPADLPGGEDTIVALSTAPGRGAVAMIRLSGRRALSIAAALGASDRAPLEVRKARHTMLRHPSSSDALDDVLVTWFKAPNSYTGESLVEITTHGGSVAPMRVLAACVAAGARPALPGEFTRRAVLNGRMDLLQAEAVADIIDARTAALQRQAVAQLDGGLSRRLLALREQIVELEALIAYDIDFPEEDDGPVAPERIHEAIVSLRDVLRALLATVPRGNMLRDGVLVVIAGPPNAGKSSLFNALLGQARAIVTSIPGTTRDAIEAVLDRDTFPLRLVDTAGLRETSDEVERLGIEVSERYLADAQVVLACGENDQDIDATVNFVTARSAARVIRVRSKSDLTERNAAAVDALLVDVAVRVSAERGDGLGELLETVDSLVAHDVERSEDSGVVSSASGASPHAYHEDIVITRERHRAGLAAALSEVESFEEAWRESSLPAPVASVHLATAREALSDLIGTVDTDEVLDRVFRDFCVGK